MTHPTPKVSEQLKELYLPENTILQLSIHYSNGLVVYVADLLRTCYGETYVMDFGLHGLGLGSDYNSPLVRCVIKRDPA